MRTETIEADDAGVKNSTSNHAAAQPVADAPPATVPPDATSSENGATGHVDWKDVRPSRTELGIGALAILAWGGFFAIGLSVPGSDFRDNAVEGFSQIAHSTTQPSLIPSFSKLAICFTNTVVTGLAYTITNVFLLTLSASFLGCMARRWATPFAEKNNDAADKIAVDKAMQEVRRAYSSAVLRSLLLYFLVIAGYFVLMPENSLNVTPGQYVRLAGAISAIAFLVGHEPKSLIRLFQMVSIAKSDANADANSSDEQKAKFDPTQVSDALTRLESIGQKLQSQIDEFQRQQDDFRRAPGGTTSPRA